MAVVEPRLPGRKELWFPYLVCKNNKFFAWRKTDTRELKHATFLSHGRQPEANIMQAKTLVSPKFSK